MELDRPRSAKSGKEYIQRLREDFVFFLQQLWEDRKLYVDAPLGAVEEDIARYIAEGPNRQVVLAFRGIGKTWFGSCAYVVWELHRDPQQKIILISKAKDHAKDSVGLCREWVRKVWFLKPLDPANKRGTKDQALAFNVAQALESRTPSLRASGVEGQITGGRAHICIPDDVETPENTKTIQARHDLDVKVKEFTAMASYGRKRVLYRGTFHHDEDSLYPKLAKRGYAIRSWPFVYPGEKDVVLGLSPMLQERLTLGEAKPNDLTAPHRFGEEDRAKYESEGELWYAMQYRLIADLGKISPRPLKLADLIVMPVHRDRAPVSVTHGTADAQGKSTRITMSSLGLMDDSMYGPAVVDPATAEYTTTKAWIDPSGRGDDEAACAAVGLLNGMLWCKGVRGVDHGSSRESMEMMCGWLRDWGVREVVIESNADTLDTYRTSFESILRGFFLEPDAKRPLHPQGWKCVLLDDTKISHVREQKELRIIGTLGPVMSTHRLVIDPQALEQTSGKAPYRELQYQLTRITREKKCLTEDGRADALAGAVRLFTDQMRMDPTRMAARAREQHLDELLKKHKHRGLFNERSEPEKPRWNMPIVDVARPGVW